LEAQTEKGKLKVRVRQKHGRFHPVALAFPKITGKDLKELTEAPEQRDYWK
jgi:hypothetical protein